MKKTVVILLLLIYGSATMGATAHLHYCMNEFVGWSLFHNKDQKCGKCGMEEKDNDGCCKDEHQHFKLKVEHQKADGARLITFITILALPVPVIDSGYHSSLNATEYNPTCHAPPDIGQKKLHVLHCVFLI